jgi:Mg-chelatase subunit ChlD
MLVLSEPWALLLALPAVWLLWRSRRRAVPTHTVANLFLWLDAPRASSERTLERRATPPWIAWVQAAVLIALAAAIAGPLARSSSPHAALIIDVSASMSARDGAQSRMGLARVAASKWLAGQRSGSRVRMIAAGPRPVVAGDVRAGTDEVSAALDRLDAAAGTADLIAAIQVARQDVAGDIAVVSDRPAPDASRDHGIAWIQVGAPADNVAITAFHGTDEGGAILEVQNLGARSQSVTIDVRGEPAPWSERVELAPSSARAFLIPPGADRTLIASLRVDDPAANAITTDDQRNIAIARTPPITILLAGERVRPIEAAVRALPGVAIEVVGELPPTPRAKVVVCSRPCTLPDRVPTLVFGPGNAVPEISRRESAGVRRVTAAANLEASPWTLTPAFPIFVADSIEWLARRDPPTLSAARLDEISEADTRRSLAPSLDALPTTQTADTRRPLWIILAALAIGGVAVEVAARRRAPALRVAAVTLILISLFGASLPLGYAPRSGVIAVDVSSSVAGNQRAAAERARLESETAEKANVSTLKFGGAESDIASGLRAARTALSDALDRRILLISDGQETTGDALTEARAAGRSGVPIDVVGIDSRAPAFIERVDAPVTVRSGAAVPIRVFLKGLPSQVLGLTITRNGTALNSRRVALDGNGEHVVALTDTAAESQMAFYRAILTDDTLGLTLSESGAAVTVTGRGRVLVISERPGAFAGLLRNAPFDIVERRPAAVPDSREQLAAFSGIVIDAVAPHRLTPQQLDAIVGAVSLDGAGLLFAGSQDSLDVSEFGPGSFTDALPIDFTALPAPPSASSSLALLVDTSGSMASSSDGVTKISAAREAIARALAVVPAADAVTVIGFAEQPVVLIGRDDARSAAAVGEKLKGLIPSGSTALAPAIRQAASWLNASGNARKRMLLVTDGKTSAADAAATTAALRGHAIEVSVVTIGRDAEREWLSELAATTGGRTYFPDRLSDLPRDVAREAGRGARGRNVSERFTVRAGAHPLAPGEPPPSLDGYVAGKLRNGASAAWKSAAGDAVLAAWPRGLGRVAAFSSDVFGPWGAPLRNWPAHASFWTRVIDWISRSADAADLDAELSLAAGAPRLIVETRSGRTAGALPMIRATLAGPSGLAETIALHAVTATRFEGPASLNEAGDYRATIILTEPDTSREMRTSRGWFWTGDRESQQRGLNEPLLSEIARVSGGRVLPPLGATLTPATAFFSGDRVQNRVNAAPWLLLIALAILSFDYIRRVSEVRS